MLNSAVYNWLRGWSTTVFFMILLIINSIFAWSFFNVTNGAIVRVDIKKCYLYQKYEIFIINLNKQWFGSKFKYLPRHETRDERPKFNKWYQCISGWKNSFIFFQLSVTPEL